MAASNGSIAACSASSSSTSATRSGCPATRARSGGHRASSSDWWWMVRNFLNSSHPSAACSRVAGLSSCWPAIRATCTSSRRSASCIANIRLMSNLYSMVFLPRRCLLLEDSAPPEDVTFSPAAGRCRWLRLPLHQEMLSRRVRVSVVEPGTVDTELISHLRQDIRQAAESQTASIEPLRPDDIADAVAYIVTRDRRVAVNEILIRAAEQTW